MALVSHLLIESLFRAEIRKKIQIEEPVSPSEWIEKHVVLSSKSSANHGNYDFDHTPVWKWPTDLLADPEVRQITVVKGVQVGGTTWMINSEFYNAAVLRLPMLHVGQTETDVKKYLKAKFRPSLEECGPLKGKLKKGTAWNELEFDSCFFDIGWGSSANSVASMSKGFVSGDEIDKYKHADKKDVHPLEGLKQRVEAFPDTHKLLLTSTPTEETGSIWQEYLQGSQSVYHAACPCCGHHQELHFSRETLKWDDSAKNEKGEWDLNKVEETAYYQCENEECGHHISESERRDIINWRRLKIHDKNPNAPKWHKSLQVSGFYSNDLTLGKIAVKFLQSKGSPHRMRTFITQVLGLPFKPTAVSNDEKTIERLRDQTPFKYLRPKRDGKPVELPFPVAYISTTVDVQGSSFWILQCAVTTEGHIAVLDWGEVFSYKEISSWVKRRYFYKDKEIKKRLNVIDSGFDTKVSGGVYDFIVRGRARLGVQFYPAVGRNNDLFDLTQQREQEWRGTRFNLISFQDDKMKELVYDHRFRNKCNEQIWFPQVIDNEIVTQLTDEQLIEKPTIDGIKMKWIPKDNNNHLGDCLKMAAVIWEHLFAAGADSKS